MVMGKVSLRHLGRVLSDVEVELVDEVEIARFRGDCLRKM